MNATVQSISILSEQLKLRALERVRENPDAYMGLSRDQQADHDVCLATLVSFDFHCHVYVYLSSILYKIFEHMPIFDEHHKTALFRFVELGHSDGINRYVTHFGAALYGDRDFVKEVLQKDRFGHVFKLLPEALRSDSELLTMAADTVVEGCLSRLVANIPSEALVKHDFLLYRVMEKHLINFGPDKIPLPFWSNKDFILQWMAQGRLVPVASLPAELGTDRDFCLALCQSQCHHPHFDNVVHWLPKCYLTDKDFVLKCLRHHYKLFDHCKELHEDVDVLLEAASATVRARWLPHFMETLSSTSAVMLVHAVRHRKEAYEEFKTFLACSWKSRQGATVSPLNMLACDDETARGLKTMIAKYLGFHETDRLPQLEELLQQLVLLVVEGHGSPSLRTQFMPLLPPKAVVQGVIDAIEGFRNVTLQTFPDEIWTHVTFVEWAAQRGMFHNKAIPVEFASHANICLSLYRCSPAMREQVVPWISDSLKQNPEFVGNCMSVHPLIMNSCKSPAIRYDFEVLFAGVHRAVNYSQLDDMAEMALEHGWADSLTFFATTLRAKLEAYYAFEAFEFEMRTRIYAPMFRAKQTIASYLDIKFPGTIFDLELVWGNRSIFCLAMGGSVEAICKSREFQTKRQKFGYLNPCDCEDDDEDDEDDEEEEEEEDDSLIYHHFGRSYHDDDTNSEY